MNNLRSIEDNLKVASAMMAEIPDFLKSNEVFWPLDASAASRAQQFPKLSIGGLLLALDQLAAQANAMTPEQAARYRELQNRYAEIADEWPANIARKAAAEMNQRVNLWRAYLQELNDNPRLAEAYPQEVRNRFLLERLLEPAQGAPELRDLRDRIAGLDRLFRSTFQPGDFVWDPRMLGSYPNERYWFLFGHPRA